MHYTYLPVVYASHLNSGSLPNVVPRKSNSNGTKKAIHCIPKIAQFLMGENMMLS